MIIKFPTGFYENVLPQNPGDGGNVTYLISDTQPPRSNLAFQQLPPGVGMKPLPDRFYTPKQRRAVLASLIFTITKASNSVTASGTKQFEVGEVLEFVDTTPTELLLLAVAPMLVQPKTERRSDTNLLDLSALGLTDAEAVSLTDNSSAVVKQLQDQLNQIRTQRADAELTTNMNQKTMNEATKALNAVQVIVDTQGMTPVLQSLVTKLNNLLASLTSQQTALAAQMNQLAANATAINDQINAVAQLVR